MGEFIFGIERDEQTGLYEILLSDEHRGVSTVKVTAEQFLDWDKFTARLDAANLHHWVRASWNDWVPEMEKILAVLKAIREEKKGGGSPVSGECPQCRNHTPHRRIGQFGGELWVQCAVKDCGFAYVMKS